MTSIESKPPVFKKQEVIDIAGRFYGLTGEVQDLVSERDQNAQLASEQSDHVLKIANSMEDRQFLEFQNAALEHILMVDPKLNVPKLVRSKSGEDITTIEKQGEVFSVRLLTYLQGDVFANAEKPVGLYRDLGRFMGRLTKALNGFMHPAALRPDFNWNLDNVMASRVFTADIGQIEDRELIEHFFERYQHTVKPMLVGLRCAVIHNDANDHNVLVDSTEGSRISGLIDFGDMVYARLVNELATTLAYALMDAPDLLTTAYDVIEGYTSEFSLNETELQVLFDLVAMRLVMSVCNSSHNAKLYPDNDYLLISQAPALRLLVKLRSVDNTIKVALAKIAAGHSLVDNKVASAPSAIQNTVPLKGLTSVDLYRSSRLLIPNAVHAATGREFTRQVRALLDKEKVDFALTPYGDKYGLDETSPGETNGCRLGIDLYFDSDVDVYSPFDGRVVSIAEGVDGYTVLMARRTGRGHGHVLYRNLSESSLKQNQSLDKGDLVGRAQRGDDDVSQLTIQLLSVLVTDLGQVPTRCSKRDWHFWSQICMDPNSLLNLPQESFVIDHKTPEVLMEERGRLLGPSLSLSYQKKLKIVRGDGAYLIDHTGRAFLDGVNNITHVGHCHPHVVAALSQQAAILNTNTRYLSEQINTLAERILKSMPDPLSVMFFVNSGSEANELAMRLVQTATGRRNMVVLDWAYHGNTGGLIEISPYKFNRRGGKGKPDHVNIAEIPDPYRGRIKGNGSEVGKRYAESVKEAIDDLIERIGEGPAAFIAESIAGVGGQVVYPPDYLKHAYRHVRAANALCIADEVQTGFGRVGTHRWAFEQQGVVPDIVTIGKPMGNGHPIAAVVTRREIADAFANGMEYFNSFGGNPVSCAVGNAVLDVIEEQDLQAQALQTGDYLLHELNEMARRYELIGDVRGSGLFIGVELVEDHDTLAPATKQAAAIVQHLRDDAVLLSTDGPWENVLKLKPPMVFGRDEANFLIEKLDAAFRAIGSSARLTR